MSTESIRKILFVRPTLGYGGADRVTINLLHAFNRGKFTCDLALMRAEGEYINDLPADVKLIDLKAKSLWSMWRPLRNLINSSNYDVIYSTCGGASMPMMLAIMLSKFEGVSVVSERNVIFPPAKNKTKRRLMVYIKALLYRRATWVTAVSKGVAKECEKILKIRPSKIIIVNNPMVNEVLKKGMKEPVLHPFYKKFSQIILAIGRFEWQKDYDTLFSAFKIVADSNKEVGLFILGKGPLEEYFKSKVSEMGLSERVEFGGFDKNPFKYISASTLYVLSSRHEGMPGTLIQAMACGTACISTDCPTGPNELIESFKNGVLVEVGNVKELSSSIDQLLTDQLLREQIKLNAPKAVEKFEESKAIKSYFDFLKK